MKFREQDKFALANGTSIDPVKLLSPILNNTVKRRIKAGTLIFHQGESPESAAILKSGIVKVYNLTSSGEEQLINFQLPSEVFPTPWVFGKTPVVLYFYQALTDCEIYMFDREEFLNFIYANNLILRVFLDYYVNNYIASVMRITALEQPRAKEKIMYTIYYLIQRYGKRLRKNQIQIRIKLTHQDIANLVGLTRETTAVEMSKLKKLGVISYVRQKYVVDESKLFEIIGDDHFKALVFD